jgi:hypothetical protein
MKYRPGRGVQHVVIKFVNDLRQVGGFLRVLRFPPSMKPIATDITEILLKLVLIPIKQTNKISSICLRFVKSCFIHFQVLLFLMRRNCNFPQNSINVSFFINFVSVHINGMFKCTFTVYLYYKT